MILNLKSQTDLSGFHVIYEGSTNFEHSGIYGISHFSEHLMCKSFEHLENEFERFGIDCNAHTTDNEIVFFLTGLDEYISKYRNDFLNLLNNFIPSEEQFLNEKNIIIEEYKDCFNDQEESHCLNITRKLYNFFGTVGKLEDLKHMKYQNMLDFIKLQYQKPTKIINISKHSEFQSNIEFNKTIFNSKLKFGNYNIELELNNIFKNQSSVIILSPIIKQDFNYLLFICEMLSGGAHSPLNKEIREKRGLVYNISASIRKIYNYGNIFISAQTSNKKVNNLIDSIKLILNNPDIYLTQERFNIVKERMLITTKIIDIMETMPDDIEEYLISPEWDVLTILENLTFDKIKEIYLQYFK